MPRYRHLTDHALLHTLAERAAQDRSVTADLLALMGEVDSRKLYLTEGYPSMHAYCLVVLLMTEDVAYKRIRVARAAYEYDGILDAVADGRLNLNSVVLLAPYLNAENANELLTVAAHKTRSEMEDLLSSRFQPLGSETSLLSVEPLDQLAARPVDAPAVPAPERVACALGRTEAGRVISTSVFLDNEMADLVGRAQALLGYQLRSDDPKEVIRRSLRDLVARLEKRKSRKPACPSRRPASENPRHIPASVVSAVWKRDGGRCTFVGDSGHRCGSSRHIQLDHIEPVARGGTSTVENLRLRCRAHNQLEAERAFGPEFMKHKRAEARARSIAEENDPDGVIPWLRSLGFRLEQARRAAEHCETLGELSLEERVRAAIDFLTPSHRRPVAPERWLQGA
jgi:5-methylcytosine-specific restriction endonuclease McrA